MKIKTRIFSAFLIAGLTLTVLGVTLLYFTAEDDLIDEIYARLGISTNSLAKNISYILQKQEEDAGFFSKIPSNIELFRSSGDDSMNISTIKNSAKDVATGIVSSQNELIELDFIDTGGNIIASTDDEKTGTNRSDIFQEIILNGKFQNIAIPESKGSKPIYEYGIYIANPVGDTIGAILLSIDLVSVYPLLEARTGLGISGETYLIDENGYIISPSKYKEDAVFKQKVDNINTQNCFSMKMNPLEHIGHSPPFETYMSYTDTEVIGTHFPIPETGWCLIVEISKEEALAPLGGLIYISIVLIVIFTIAIAIVAYYVSRNISLPISELQKGINIIEEGNLDYKVNIDKDDEIGSLSKSFNMMTDAIKKSRSFVDEKVGSQTESIKTQRDELEKQQNAILNILEDVKDEKDNVSREKIKIESLLDSIGDGIIATDQAGYITVMNKSAENMIGWTLKELKGKKILESLRMVDESGKDIPIEDRPLRIAIESGEKITTVISKSNYYVRKNNTVFPAGITVSPIIWTDKIIGTIEVFRDVTTEKNVDKAKTEFVSLASHQLRTPLSAINWYTEMLLAGDAGELKDEQRKYLREIALSNDRMVVLVDALLNVSRLELGTLMIDPELQDIRELADEVIKELQSKIDEKKIDFVAEYSENLQKMSLDKKLTQIIFQNLLTNAIKYTPEKGEINLYVLGKDKHIEIRVTDTGMGIPKEQQEKIFSKLFRADNVKGADTDGTGLGLYLVKLILDQCNGSIEFHSEENKGATFIITIPLEGMQSKIGSKKLT